jgi:hypothetical protein
MAGKMNINLFEVSRDRNTVPLVELLNEISHMSLDRRIRPISFGQMRLDIIAPPNSETNESPYWLLDFTKLRFDHGPGRVGRTTEIAGFDLEDDEGFGEETAALYDADAGFMLVQYNHHGVRAASIEKYFNAIGHNPDAFSAYKLLVKMDQTSEIKLARKQFISKIHYKISTSNLTEAHRNAGLSLRQSLALSEEQRGGSIEITISAPPRENLFMASARQTIEALREMVAADQAEDTRVVTQFEVEGRDDVLDRAEAVNMISPKLVLTIDGLTLGGDRRYTRRSRWDALLRARRGWHDIIG